LKQIRKIALFAVGDDGWQGGIQYITNVLNGLNAVGDQHKLEVHLFRHSAQNFPDLPKFTRISIQPHNIEEELPGWDIKNRAYWFAQRKFGKRINPRLENYLLHHQFDYAFPVTLSACGGQLNSGSWIADFQYHHFPNGASKKVIQSAKDTISNIAHNTDKIILSSQYCADDCVSLFPVSKGKTHVMPFAVYIDESLLGFTDFESLQKKYSLPSSFLMVANLFAPTKNHKTLFNALGMLKKQGIEVDLVCTGNIVDYRNEGYANEILQCLTENKIRPQVHLLGLIPRTDQVQLYRMSVALVQPSVNEGWSTSVEEAKALGKTLFLSNIPVHLEQYPKNPYFFKSLDAAELAEKIKQVWLAEKDKSFPDREKEQKAFGSYKEAVKNFGRHFLEIAGR
jgi:glycosyltransferase involved in cell wall biosynthesis